MMIGVYSQEYKVSGKPESPMSHRHRSSDTSSASGSGSSSKISGPSLGDKGKQRAVDWHDEPDEPGRRWSKSAEEAAMVRVILDPSSAHCPES